MLDWISTHIPPWVWLTLIIPAAALGTVAYLILLERKVAAWTQDRVGPNRVGLGFGIIPWLKDRKMLGLGQPLADGLKFFLKEDYKPAGVDSILFTVAPAVMMLVVFIAIAVIPWGGVVGHATTITLPAGANSAAVDAAIAASLPQWHQVVGEPVVAGNQVTFTHGWFFQIANLNIGALYIIAVLSLAVYGIVVGGWASNNKYSFLGGLRATAQMISYEIPLGLSLLTVAVMFGTLDLGVIVQNQAHYWLGFIPAWNVFCQPLAFVVFLICIHAEANRAPFDLAEAEQELVGGYHTEYSSMRFALFFLAEYAGMIVTSALCVALFFGGWHFPGLTGNIDPANPAVTDSLWIAILRFVVFFAKLLLVIFIFMWVRWSLPRFRFDQLMMLSWRALIPISLALLVITAVVIYIFGPNTEIYRQRRWLDALMAAVLLAANVIVMVAAVGLSFIVPAAPPTNRRLAVEGSRFAAAPLPAKA